MRAAVLTAAELASYDLLMKYFVLIGVESICYLSLPSGSRFSQRSE